MAEWLRRLTRNQFPSGSAGSSPADCEIIFLLFINVLTTMLLGFCNTVGEEQKCHNNDCHIIL